MTLAEMRADAYSRLGYAPSPAADVIARVDRFINEAQRELVTMRGLARLRRSVLTFSAVANSPYAVLPQAAVRIAGIQDRTTQRSLREVLIQDIRFIDPGLNRLMSNPDAYAILNMSAAVALDPSAAHAIDVVSTSASDTQTAYIEGITTGGYSKRAAIPLTGVTKAAFDGSDWIFIQKFYLDSAAVGVVTLLEDIPPDSPGPPDTFVELSRITPGHYTARYTRIHLFGTPTQAVTYYADVDLHVEDLLSAGDSPYLPEDFHWLLVCAAQRKEAEKRKEWDGYNAATARWREGVANLKAHVRQRTDDGHSGMPSQFSQLGPWFSRNT